jgi:hypothetical protein
MSPHIPPYPNRRQRNTGYTAPVVVEPRMFFECADCGMFHESVLILDCKSMANRFNLGDVPVGGLTGTEVHYLDGKIERVPPDEGGA